MEQYTSVQCCHSSVASTRAKPTGFSVTLGSHIFQISKILVILAIISKKSAIFSVTDDEITPYALEQTA